MSTTRNSNESDVVVVTGASTGIGQATAQLLAQRGFTVLAGMRDPSKAVARERVRPVALDITRSDHVATLVDRVEATGGRLAAVVNNAGIAVNAPVELIPLAEWRRQLETNVLGHVAVTQALLPRLIADHGRIVNVSSIGGRVAGPTYGAYSASKFALEAVSDVLRRELRHLGVSVIVVEPGAIATPIWDKGTATLEELTASMTDEQRGRYAQLIEAVRTQARNGAGGLAPESVAAAITGAISARRPKTRYLVGRDAKMMARIASVLPDRTFDAVIARAF
jgi:NAD(P)-dependent dehydrogenase (short-subunit alcohol dehydrogenase family)